MGIFAVAGKPLLEEETRRVAAFCERLFAAIESRRPPRGLGPARLGAPLPPAGGELEVIAQVGCKRVRVRLRGV